MEYLFDNVPTSEENENHSDDLRKEAIHEFGKDRVKLMSDDDIIEEIGNNSFN